MMILLARWAGLLTLVFLLPVALIPVLPYDVSALLTFLAPSEGCPAPCFMGIRPGVTSADEAIVILETHAWVREVSLEYFNPENVEHNLIYWEWSGRQPRFIDGRGRGRLTIHQTDSTNSQIVGKVSIQTTIPLGELVAAVGSPSRSWLSYIPPNTPKSTKIHVGIFEGQAITVNSFVHCPVTVQNLATQPIYQLSFGPPGEQLLQYQFERPFPFYAYDELKALSGC